MPIGAWVLREACAQAATLGRGVERARAARGVGEPLGAPARRRRPRSRPSRPRSTSAGLDPSLLVLEITETTLMADRDHAIDVLRRAHRRSACGSASTTSAPASRRSAYLRSLPVHTLKIDRSFVEALGHDPEGGAIVAAVVQLGHALGLSVTAEGVETPDQLAELRALGCDLGQGFYFAHPQPGAIVRALVHHRFHWRQRDAASSRRSGRDRPRRRRSRARRGACSRRRCRSRGRRSSGSACPTRRRARRPRRAAVAARPGVGQASRPCSRRPRHPAHGQLNRSSSRPN